MPTLALAVLLLASAAPPPDLVESARQFERLAATQGQESESARLKRLFDLYWETSLRASPEFATYVGYPGFEGRWSDSSPETLDLLNRIALVELAALSSIDRSRLSAAEQVDYDLMRRRLEMQIAGERFPGHYLLINKLSGIDQDLVYLLEYDPNLERLRGFPIAVDQTIALLRQGMEAGITPPKVTLRGLPERVGSLVTDDPWQSPVLAPFLNLPEREQAARIFTEQVAPALRKLHGFLADTYVPGARETIAMSDLPDGKAWYAYKLRAYTDLAPGQIHQLGLSEVERIRREMDALIASTGFQGSFAEFSEFLRTDPRFFYDRPEDLVAGYRDIVKRIDPGLVKLFGRLPRLPYGVKAMEDGAAKTAPAGYYNSGSLAGGMPGWFLVNTWNLKGRPKWEMEALALHESVPGHHLQYSIAAEELGDLPGWRKWDIYPVFSEGWGLYAESLGSELGLYKDPYSKFGQLTNEVWRAIRLVVDTGLHTLGWTRQQALDYYRANCAKTAHDIEVEVDRIIAQPGTVPVYKIGELKIRELRSFAERELGPKFDLRAFHDRLLGRGQLPLDLLEKSIKGWVAESMAYNGPAPE